MSSGKLVLYSERLSQPCRTVELFLLVNRIPFTFRHVDLASREHFTDGFVRMNPLRRVPVIDHNGYYLSESIAILRYLAREFKVADHWYPKDSRKQAKVDEFLEWYHIGMRWPCAGYVRKLCFEQVFKGKETNEKLLSTLKKHMIQSLDILNDVWLKDKPFVAGSDISIADLVGVEEVEMLVLTGYDPKDGRPNIKAWLERVKKATSPHYDKVLERLNDVMPVYKQMMKPKL